MTRYILKPAINMYDCDLCVKEFKNGRSLASHRYTYHKNQQIGLKLKDSYGGGVKDEIPTIKRWKVNNQNGIVGKGVSKYQSDESSNEDSFNEIADDVETSFEKNTHSEKSQENIPNMKNFKSKKRCREYEDNTSFINTEDSSDDHLAKRSKEEIIESIKPTQQNQSIFMRNNDQEEEISSKIMKSDKYEDNKNLLDLKTLKNLNEHNKSMINPKHAKLIKNIFKFVLNGSIPLEQHHISKIKPHRSFVRKIAHGKIGAIKKAIHSGKSICKSILQIALPILVNELL